MLPIVLAALLFVPGTVRQADLGALVGYRLL